MLRKTIFILFIFPDVLCKCPNGTFEYQSNCYLFNNTETGFAAAEVYCNGMNGHLVSIHDAFVNAMLGEAKIYFHGSSDTDFWIGANNLISKSKWNWTDGTNFDFTDWNKGEPKNVTGSNCAALSVIDGIWSAQDCFKLKPFVCKILPTADSPVYKNCTIGWFYFAPTDSCYGVSAKGFVGNWTASEGYCEKLGAFLPSFNSFAEYQLVTSYVYTIWSSFWTDIVSVNGGKTWKTSDGSNSEFIKYGPWCAGFPLTENGERCVDLASNGVNGCFRDRDCSVAQGFTLCKKNFCLKKIWIIAKF